MLLFISFMTENVLEIQINSSFTMEYLKSVEGRYNIRYLYYIIFFKNLGIRRYTKSIMIFILK